MCKFWLLLFSLETDLGQYFSGYSVSLEVNYKLFKPTQMLRGAFTEKCVIDFTDFKF